MLRRKEVIALRPLFNHLICKRLFKTSDNQLIRRVINVRHTTNVPKPGIAENKSTPYIPALQSNENFYGIDGDEGVIFAKENESNSYAVKNNPIQQQDIPAEILYPTAFGVIRCDSANQVKYHGQFESESEILQMKEKKKSLNSIGDSTSHSIKTEDRSMGFVPKYSEIEEDSSDTANSVCFQGTLIDSRNICDGNKNCNVTQNASFIDEMYFQENLVEKNTNDIAFKSNNNYSLKEMLHSKNTDEKFDGCSHSLNIQSKASEKSDAFAVENDLNFIDGQYVQTVSEHSCNLDTNSAISSSSDNLLNVVSNYPTHENNPKVSKSVFYQNNVESNYSEDKSFNTSQNATFRDRMHLLESITKEDANINCKDRDFHEAIFSSRNTEGKDSFASNMSSKDYEKPTIKKGIHSNLFDKQYFQTVSKNTNTNLDSDSSNSSSYKLKQFINAVDDKYSANDTMNKQKIRSTDSHKEYESSTGSTDKFSDCSAQIQDDGKLKFGTGNQQGNDANFFQNKSVFSFQSVTEKNLKNNSQFKYKLHNQIKSKNVASSTSLLSEKKIPNDDFVESSEAIKISNESDFLSKSKPFLDFKSDLKHEEVKTAHDYALKLRAEKKTYHSFIQKGRIVLPKESKLDSKGFKILENEVPNFRYCTNDEILELLRNSVLYLDENLMVLSKPYNMVIHDSKTTNEPCLSQFLDDLAKELDKKNSSPKLFTVHRIDKETTGCLLLARNEMMAQTLKSYFAQRKILKTYWIISTKVPDPREGIIDIPIAEGLINKKSRMVLEPDVTDVNYKNHCKNGKRAVTRFKVLSEYLSGALVEVKPETGIKHQIRVHFGFGLSCPILGDHKYSHLDKLAPQKLQADMLQRLKVRQSKVRHIPMHIHAQSIVIPEYFTNRDFYISAPLPEHMKRTMKALKLKL